MALIWELGGAISFDIVAGSTQITPTHVPSVLSGADSYNNYLDNTVELS